jgi:pimeloyl-ACP methyl ester carboxylesterase
LAATVELCDTQALPIYIAYGTADVTVPPASHCLTFAAGVNGLGGNVTVVPVTGGGHLDATFWSTISVAPVLAFLAQYV